MSKYKYVVAPTQLDDLKSQIKMVHTALKEYFNLTPVVGDKTVGRFKLSLTQLQNIISRQLGYSSFSDLKLKIDSRKDSYKPVPLFDLIDVEEVVHGVCSVASGLMSSDIRNAIGFLVSSVGMKKRYGSAKDSHGVPMSEYPYVCELKDIIDGFWVSSLGAEYVVPEMYPKGEAGYKQYLGDMFRNASDEVWLEYQDDPTVGMLGGAATRTFKTLAHLDRFIASRIKRVRAGALGGSWEYLNPLLLDVGDDEVVAVLGEDSLNEPVPEIEGLEDSILVGYCELHNQTERALFSGHQLERLCYLAGTKGMPKFDLANDEFGANKALVDKMVESAKAIRREFDVE